MQAGGEGGQGPGQTVKGCMFPGQKFPLASLVRTGCQANQQQEESGKVFVVFFFCLVITLLLEYLIVKSDVIVKYIFSRSKKSINEDMYDYEMKWE